MKSKDPKIPSNYLAYLKPLIKVLKANDRELISKAIIENRNIIGCTADSGILNRKGMGLVCFQILMPDFKELNYGYLGNKEDSTLFFSANYKDNTTKTFRI